MNYAFDSRLGKQLYRLLPEVYRTRDKKTVQAVEGSGTEDLAKYLDAHGHLLDLIHATLEQQLRDALPKSSQDWLLPYFAQLLAANIVSPDSDGRHAEISHAVSWRQRKGTLKCAEEIAEAVGQMEVEIQEGWKRVAMTPHIGMPIIPAKALDATLDIDMTVPTVPSEAIRHPTLPAAMVDLRWPSRAVEAPATNPAARISSFGGVKQTWRQANPHGVPCFPGSFDDVSRRTVDIRTPDAINGHYHHKCLLAYAPPPTGLFPFDPIQLKWDERRDSLYEHLIEEKEENGVSFIRNKTNRIIEITDDVTLRPANTYRVEGLNFKTKLSVVVGGSLELHRVEAVEVQVDTSSTDEPVLTAKDCLFNELSVGVGPAKLDSCTILTKGYLYDIDAVDCIFMDMSGTSISGVVQYSRIPVKPPIDPDNMTIEDSTKEVPKFFGERIKYDIDNERDNNGAGVLKPDCSENIYTGASDGREMGYFHHGRKARPVRIAGIYSFELPDNDGYPLEELIFKDAVKVISGKLKLRRAAVQEITVVSNGDSLLPVLDAKDCLFDKLTVANGLARLECCTIMDKADCKHLRASDCIFKGNVTYGAGNEPLSGCVRYSRIPEGFDGSTLNVHIGRTDTNTRAMPIFNKFSYCKDSIAIRALAIDPQNSATIYAGTNGGGVFKSMDGGLNWAEMNTVLTDLDVRALVVDPSNRNIIYTGTYGGGVFSWDDSNRYWVKLNEGLTGPYGQYVQALAVDPNDSTIIYVGTNGGGVFKRKDAGLNWLVQNNGLTNLDVQALAIDPAGTHHASHIGVGFVTGTLYVGTNGGGVFRWDNTSRSWVKLNKGLTDLNVQALAIDPKDSTIIYAGTNGGGVFKSVNGGRYWAEKNTDLTDLNVRALAIDPTGTLYVGTNGGGVFSWDDGGQKWTQKRAARSLKVSVRRNARFGEPGYGVLDPVTPDAVRFGAEDGGEMGACHHKYYSLKTEAVLDKMREFLPVGIEPVLIQDTRLLHVPPEQKKTNII
ncbi:MAG: hypothetical protein GY774_03910 [Planctomycetes bacterium]|nr:hypothetical protein [Planctomycetota bacterium]